MVGFKIVSQNKIMQKKNYYKPTYKYFLRLRKNIQDRPKLFKFKKQKWIKFQSYLKNQLAPHKRFKIKDQFNLTVSKIASKGNSFQKKFRNNLFERKAFSLFYGKLSKRSLKKNILKPMSQKNFNYLKDFRATTLTFFESRLDTVIYRSKFSLSMKEAAQLILHGCILVNGSKVTSKSFILKTNDLIKITHDVKARELVKKALDKSNFWPIPPKHLLINYKTLQILFVLNKKSNLIPIFNHFLNINSVIANIKKY